MHGYEVHRDRPRAHPGGGSALRSGGKASQNADPCHACAAGPQHGDGGDARDCDQYGGGRPQKHAGHDDTVERAALQLAWDRQRADNGADAESRGEQSKTARAERKLIARDHGQQRPECACAQTEAQVPADQRPHRRRMSSKPQAAHGAGEDLLWNAGEGGLAIPPSFHRDEHRTEKSGTRKERAPRTRARGERQIHCYRAQRDCPRQLCPRYEAVDACLLRGHVKREAATDEKRQREQRCGAHDAGKRRDAEENGRRQQQDLRRENHLLAVDDVRQRAGRETKQQGRRRARGLHQRHHERRRRQRGHEPGSDGRLHRVAQCSPDRAEIEKSKRDMSQRR